MASHSRKMPPKLGQADFVIVELMQIRFLNGLHGSKVVADNVMNCAYPVLYRGLFLITLMNLFLTFFFCRSTHNELEKNRRAHLRSCLENLKDIVSILFNLPPLMVQQSPKKS